MRLIKKTEAIGAVLAHDIAELRPGGGSKGRVFKKGHGVSADDIPNLFDLGTDELHKNETAWALARELVGDGVSERCRTVVVIKGD